jgi:DUF1680 family protein
VKVTVTPAEPKDFTFHLRIPGWANGASIAVNGKPEPGAKPGEYLAIRRNWKPGDSVTLNLPMETEVVASNPRVAEDRGKVAVRRGPVIFCMEEVDQAKSVALADVSISLSQSAKFTSEYKPDLLGGVTVLHHGGGVFEVSSAEEALYAPASLAPAKTRPAELTFIPYYAWANRQPCAMQVWTPYVRT